MDAVLIAVCGLAGLGALIVAARRLGRREPTAPPPRHDDSAPHRARATADADIEEHDIDAMLDAINERRRRRGAREVGDELSDELMRGTWDD